MADSDTTTATTTTTVTTITTTRTRPRARGYAGAASQTSARLALCGFAGDPSGYDALLEQVRRSAEAYTREFGGVLSGDVSGEEEEEEEEEEEKEQKEEEEEQDHKKKRRAAALAARSAFHHAFASNPFACAKCWLLPGTCICAQLRQMRTPLPTTHPVVARIIVHCHHSEWRRASSTGCLAPLVLSSGGGGEGDENNNQVSEPQVQCFMAGHAPHDATVRSLVSDPRWLPVLLFPRREQDEWKKKNHSKRRGDGPSSSPSSPPPPPPPPPPQNVTPAQAIQLARDHNNDSPKILLIVPDGTWQQARRLSLNYAPGGQYHDPRLRFLELDSAMVAAVAARGGGGGGGGGGGQEDRGATTTAMTTSTSSQPQQQRTVSLLAPARLYRGAAKCPQRVSTAEALAAALEALGGGGGAGGGGGGGGGSPAASDALVRAVQLKVEAVRRQSNKSKLPLPS
jgi:DTW domain-containing protein YfiP